MSLNKYKLLTLSIIVAIALASYAVYLHKQRDASSNDEPSIKPITTPAEEYTKRYIDEPWEIRFVKAMPKMRSVMYKMCQEGWDTGTTVEMRQASYEFIDFLESSWIRLAEFYPAKHFDGSDPKVFIRKYIQDRFKFHWAKHEPEGPGTGGTIVGVMTGGDVIADLEAMIADTVTALFPGNESIDLNLWLKQWRRKP
ncbi:MAG: hypothetical protein P4L51_20565 [Puia sp.]|nr:hypothetical protein [Puia sp.]